MVAIPGVGGSVKQAAVVIANIDNWSLDVGSDFDDVTSFQAAGSWRSKIASVKKWSAKCVGNFDGADTTGQQVLTNGIGQTFTMTFMTDAVHQWTGTAILIQIIPKAPVANKVTIEYAFEGTGAVTYT